MNGLYKLFNYTEKEKIEIEYLTSLIETLDIMGRADEALFQFSPSLVEEKTIKFNEHEPWAVFHKKMLIHEIIIYLIEQSFENEYDSEYEINEVIWNDKYVNWFKKTDLSNKSKKEIINIFKKMLKN